MNTLLVSYDLRTPGKDYQRLWDHLKSYSDYFKPLESLWLIKTSSSAKEGRDEIKQFMDSNDRLIVINVTGREAAWNNLGNAANEWIKDNL
jgi:hypothetical protein